MTRIVVRLFARAVLFSIVALPGSVQAQSLPELDARRALRSPRSPSRLNIQVDPLLQPLVEKLLRQSPTVRRQWQAIGASRLVRVSLRLDRRCCASRRRRAPGPRSPATPTAPSAPWSSCRAPSTSPSCCRTSSSTSSNRSKAWISRRWRRTAHRACRNCRRGVYETARARNAGFDALREVYGETDQAFSAAMRGVQRAFKALLPDGRVAADAAPAPGAAPRQRRRRRFREAIQPISSSNRIRRLILFAYSLPVGDTRWCVRPAEPSGRRHSRYSARRCTPGDVRMTSRAGQ